MKKSMEEDVEVVKRGKVGMDEKSKSSNINDDGDGDGDGM
ncbi:hypothetical protein BCD_1625 (plasmid) [Borrelia crocidurae DOU]|uniref:Uncharacterized protein n=1 Tax=Borrelia crocidurae DOU TaxID=1293575 RepID=W5SRJ2_9SPIR|nr:hypothetical protein BCD_1625 [Borrelia crocidurae DOU]